MKEIHSEANIGFVGLGAMGEPMAQNLLKAGFRMTVYGRRPEALKNVLASGARPVRILSDLACCDVVFIMVNTGDQVEDVVLGKDGIIQGFKDDHSLIIIVMSTISPMTIKKISGLMRSKKISFVDAPVSGMPVVAMRGTLTFMVGGQEDVVESVKPYLQVMGKNIFYTGPLGTGLATKLLNNILAIANLYLLPEVMRIGIEAGLDVKTMVEVFRTSSGKSWCVDEWSAYTGFMKMMIKDQKLHDSFNSIVTKDLGTALEMAEKLGYESDMLKVFYSMIKSVAESTGVMTKKLFNKMMDLKM